MSWLTSADCNVPYDGNRIPVGAVADKNGFKIVTAYDFERYQEANKVPLAAARTALVELVNAFLTDYRFGWGQPRWEINAIQNVQREQQRWETENFPRTRPWLEPFEVIQPYSFAGLGQRLDDEMTILFTKVMMTEDLQPSDLSNEIPEPDPYEDPLSHRPDYHERGKILPTSGGLPLYTEEGRGETMEAIVEFTTFLKELPYIRAELAPKFYFARGHGVRRQSRSAKTEKLSILGLLYFFLMAQTNPAYGLTDYHVDLYDPSGLHPFDSTIESFLKNIYSMPDEDVFTDKTSLERSDDGSESNDDAYPHILADRAEYRPSSKVELEKGLLLLAEAIDSLATRYSQQMGKVFKKGLSRDHPDVLIAWDLAKEQYQFLRFYARSLYEIWAILKPIPLLTTAWVEPTRAQVRWYKNNRDIDGDYLALHPSFFGTLNIPETEVDIETQRLDNMMEAAQRNMMEEEIVQIGNNPQLQHAIDIENEYAGLASDLELPGPRKK
ncbi:hypothetical protein TWF730_008411 [Orbilia blumenaviensis]|uniref:Phage portal protein n=1 Tax=Orbilia blumenaviensis TaxID=1796055 RepID=A0AAV9V2D8_9PEZI